MTLSQPHRERERDRLLVDVLNAETRILSELAEAMITQRNAIATDDLPTVETTIQLTSSLLAAVQDIRRRRAELMEASEMERPMLRLVTDQGGTSGAVRAAAQHLYEAANRVAREGAMNQTVLRRVLDSGEAFLQELFSTAIPAGEYPASTQRPEPVNARTGVLVNRSA
jgi:hypothetical protein